MLSTPKLYRQSAVAIANLEIVVSDDYICVVYHTYINGHIMV
jgi:hypothetical protein